MALKIAGHLFTGPYEVEKAVVRKNHQPVVFAVLSKEGPPWDPAFRVIEVGATGEGGAVFADDPRCPEWRTKAEGQLCIYMLPLEGAEFRSVDAREKLADEIRTRHAPPNEFVRVTG